jgi:lipoprotein-releasing system permease protein
VYHVLLTNRYLTTRVIPLIAVAAVALCVALVIIVVSVMTGFLDMVRSSGRTLMGDVVIEYPIQGIPHYERLMAMIEELPEAVASTPVVDSAGALRMPYPAGPNKDTVGVRFWGIEPESYKAVTGFADTLYWRPLSEEETRTARKDDLRRIVQPEMLEEGLTLRDQRSGRPGIVLGMHVSRGNQRMTDGSYHPLGEGYWWMPEFEVTLSTFPIDTSGGLLTPENFIFPVVNEFVSGVYAIDEIQVMIPLDIAQRMVHLDEAQRVDPDDPTLIVGTIPARVTRILVRSDDATTPLELRELVVDVYREFIKVIEEEDPLIQLPEPGFGLHIMTWEQQQARFIGPVEKERELMRILFSIIYLVAAGLVLAIFWAIVHEKTRDIGILRSVGASRLGISMIFLRYGAIIGIVGSIVGLGLAFLVVRNINAIHDAIGNDAPAWSIFLAFAFALASLTMTIIKAMHEKMLPVVLWSLGTIAFFGLGVGLNIHRGTLLWDPSVYYFAEIPNTLDVNTAITTMIGAVIFSILGAFIPAAKAADTDPVNALRYE